MKYIIKPKNTTITSSDTSLGEFYSNDRFYSIINKKLTENIKSRSSFVSFILDYFFYSTDFKKNQYINKKTKKIIEILDFICILSFITFIILFITVISVTSVNAKDLVTTTINGTPSSILTKFGEAFFNNINQNIVLLSFSLLFLIIFIWWLVIYYKFRKKCKSMALSDYLLMKIDFCSKSKLILKAIKNSKKLVMHNINNNFNYYIENFTAQEKRSDIWLNLQIINEMSFLFDDFNLYLKVNIVGKKECDNLKEIIKNDFLNINVIEN